MASLINLPGYQANALWNFAPISDAIDSNRKNALMQGQLDIKREQLGMQRQQFEGQQQDALIKRFAGLAQGVEQEQDPAKRAEMWNNVLAQHPKGNSLPAIYRDPMQGPRMLMQEAQGFQDPLQKRYTEAQIGLAEAKARQAATGGEAPSNVREWKYFSGLSPDEKRQYLTMRRGDKYLDTGTEFVLPNPVAPGGAPASSIRKDPGGAAALKAEGTQRGQARVDLPKVEENAATTMRYIDEVLKDPNLTNVTGWQARLPTVRSSSIDTEERIAQLGGRAFLTAFESLKGGGQITEIEGKKATDALARLTNLKQSDSGYVQALRDFRREVNNLVLIARRRAGQSVNGPAAGPSVPRQFTDRLPQEQPTPSSQGMIPPGAVQLLRGNPAPEVIQQFEAKYGPGSARQFLGGN